MSSNIASISAVAGGTINPFSFIMPQPNVLNGAIQATGSGSPYLGVGPEWVQGMMGTFLQTTLLPQGYPSASTGQAIRVYGALEEALLMVGSGQTVVANNLLVSDASGFAVPCNIAASGQQWVGAQAIEGGTAGSPIRVRVLPPTAVTHS